VSRIEVERNRSGSTDRPRMSKVAPGKNEGRDGDERFVEIGGKTYRYSRINGRWKRVEVGDA